MQYKEGVKAGREGKGMYG